MKKLILATAALAVASGCVSRAPQMDAQFGHAVLQARSQQTLDMEAASKAGVPLGMEGKTAHSAYEQYQKSYRAPEPQPQAFTIGIGSSAGGK